MSWAIAFGLVIFAIVTLILTAFLAFNVSAKANKKYSNEESQLEQLTEYFIRACESSGEFPKGNEIQNSSDYSKYTWMDSGAITFFENFENSYHYTYTTGFGDKDANSYYRNLLVKDGSKTVLSVAVAEKLIYQNGVLLTRDNYPITEFEIVQWEYNKEPGTYSSTVSTLSEKVKGFFSKIFGSSSTQSEESVIISYDTKGGNSISADVCAKGGTFKLPTPTHPDNVAFSGWYKDGALFGNGGDSVVVSSDLDLVAKWADKAYVTLYYSSKSYDICEYTPKGSEQTLGSDMLVLPSTISAKYNLKEWSIKDPVDGGPTISSNQLVIPANYSDNIVLSVTLSARSFKVNYKKNTNNETTYAKYTYSGSKARTVTITFTDNSGDSHFKFTKWTTTKSGVTFASATSLSTTVTIPKGTYGNFTVVPNYNYYYNVTVGPKDSNGTVSNSGTVEVAKDTKVTVSGAKLTIGNTTYTATPNTNYLFNSWSVSNGDTITSDTTITASFTPPCSVTVKAGSNGSVSNAGTIKVSKGTTVSVSNNTLTINGTKYTATPNSNCLFDSWSISNGASITSDTTITASFIPPCSVTITAGSNGSVSNAGTINVTKGTKVSVSGNTLTIDGKSYTATPEKNYSCSWNISDGDTITSDKTITASFSKDSCFVSGTLITMADGTQKPIEEITDEDKIMAWDFFNGTYVARNISLLINHGYSTYDIANLEFSDSTVLRIVLKHEVFDYDLNKFVNITTENCTEFIGHRFVKYRNDGNYDIVTLTNAYTNTEQTDCYSIASGESMNAFAEGLLTLSPAVKFLNWVEMDGKLHYDVDKFNAIIDEYGTYDYDVFKDYVTYDQYVNYCGPYLKAGVEQGYYPFEYIIGLIKEYNEFMPK